MNYFKQFFRFAVPYKIYGILNILCNTMYALFSALSFIAIFPVLKVLFNTEADQQFYQPEWTGIINVKQYLIDSLNCYIEETTALHGKMPILTYVIIVIISIFLLKNLFGYLALYFITFLRNGVLKDIRNELYDKIVSLPLSFYSEKRKGDTIARITSDVLEIQNSFLSILELIVREPLTIFFTLVSMVLISVKLTLFVFVFIPVSGFIISLVGKTLKKQSDKVQREQGQFLSVVEETLGGLKVIKGFNAESRFSQKFKASTQRYFDFSNTLLNRQNLASPTSEFLGICVIAVLLWYGGILVFKDKSLEPESFIVFIGLAYNILTPAKAISKANYSVRRGNAAAERVLEVLNTPSPLADQVAAQTKQDFTTAITLENVSFKYEDDYVLKDFNLTVKKGTSVALVGQSGSGKSTIANLVTRFYDVSEGTIALDNTPIKKLTKQSLRQLIGLVTQDSILFNDTIKENLCIGKEDATDEEVIAALKVANAWEFVKDLPKHIHTNIGDSGNKLSGGQKQRLSIARAVLKNPPIMILDEATSALDTESERLVQAALENMMRNRTSIVIAHRLSTIQNSDRIVVMHKGSIVEQGTHEELLQKQGTYYKLVSMQSFEE
ncbi:ABC transporter ATP-binding protein/permease [Aquimarina sp. ERC-38]|uniref:ABC transporter ATP-binding protein n=1 Tax=Aquimarina sp. ERC-38 TaxID=2949996 RepID=UPI002248532D|nr:ABC transporter ATP-binding protein [Aquimarina sp. ERC-38]UZO80751.1 ABC transporter ATP-binding protein/permease [Aquimarina sp. ERC-38]